MGGNVFKNTEPFDQANVDKLVNVVNRVLTKAGANAMPIGSASTPTPGKMSGDLDLITDLDALATKFKSTDEKEVRKKLRSMFDDAGFETAQSGVSVHVKVPLKNTAHQVDIMIVGNARRVAKFHTHKIPANSPYKGVHKHLALNFLARRNGLLWSPYQGLYKRNEDGKRGTFYSDDIDHIAEVLLGPDAKGKDLASLESIMAAMQPHDAEEMLAALKADKSWKESVQESAELQRIKVLSGIA